MVDVGRTARRVQLVRPCTIDDGIERISEEDFAALVDAQDKAANEGRWSKFVPASGAASRMFALLSSEEQRTFCDSMSRFAFHSNLSSRLSSLCGDDLSSLIQSGRFAEVIRLVVSADGLGYGDLPKGLVPFHRYDDAIRTPFEEHLLEGISCFRDRHGDTRAHFTVASEHESAFAAALSAFTAPAEVSNPIVDFSIQDPSTNTIAVDREGRLFRDEDGMPISRPGGHGALLENLNRMKADLVFTKNIDNVAHSLDRNATLFWTRLLGGYLVRLEKATHHHLRTLDACGERDGHAIDAARDFVLLTFPGVTLADESDRGSLRHVLQTMLRRPIRVCGMVKNEGEPGGGPFWIRQPDGRESLQIVESAEIDQHDALQNEIVQSATHFNPVFMAFAVRDDRGKPFDLHQFSDESRAIITQKDIGGRRATVLERPGLWNGAMANWNSIFVEVPAEVFTPVKTVLDLLRPEHQPPLTSTPDSFATRGGKG